MWIAKFNKKKTYISFSLTCSTFEPKLSIIHANKVDAKMGGINFELFNKLYKVAIILITIFDR
jgi:hypothetical protein